MKFGGTSVATRSGWRVVEAAARQAVEQGARPVLVCSAMAGASNLLDRLADAAAEGVTSSLQPLRDLHRRLADELGIEPPPEVEVEFDVLADRLAEIRAARCCVPEHRARILAVGEMLSTRIGAAGLARRGLDVGWRDARELLRAAPSDSAPAASRFLSVQVDLTRPLVGALDDALVVVTQGFIASDDSGRTVLLGRGGSDTSAACLGALLGADRVEIWTDVAGMFSANPAAVPTGRPLAHLHYDEAEALATLGARVLHPSTIGPLRASGIPLSVRSTLSPTSAGTQVDSQRPALGIRAVTGRDGLILIRVTRPPSWQPVGFLAEVSSCFANHGFSMDLVSTSPSTIAVTLDPAAVPGTSIDEVVRDLGRTCEVTVERRMSSVSLVGTGVRAALDRLGSALLLAGSAEVRMVSQGASDHHLTLVVPQGDADGLLRRLHDGLLLPPGHAPRPQEVA
ncbi:MAG: aspartate kinase [Myxococcales bacterium]|nr:aspartate kinase [Myxococcales bacterium]